MYKSSNAKTLIDCTSCCNRISGIERYTIEVTNGLLKSGFSGYIVALPKNPIGINVDIIPEESRVISWSNNRLFNEWLFLPFIYIINRINKVFFPGFPPSAFFLFAKAKLIRTVYDVVVWKYSNTISFKTKFYTKVLETLFIKRHSLILTISKNAAKLILEEFPDIKVPIVNTYLGVNFNSPVKSNPDQKFSGLGRYILSVSTLEPRKNFPFLIKAFKEVVNKNSDIKLVLAGRHGWGYEEIVRHVKELSLEEKVILTGGVSEEELNSLYKHCEFFVFPSLYEGFGLTVLEALSFGKFVISSNAASLPEVLGNAGLLLNIDNYELWAKEICLHLENPEKRLSYLSHASEQLNKFNWQVVTNLILKEINRLDNE